MGSPITFSGFNSIDFTAVLEAVMKQESQPLTTLQTQQKALQSKAATFRTLATKLATFESAVSALKDDNALLGRTASSTNDSAVKVSAGTTAAPGIYDITVQELARAQVTASITTVADANGDGVSGDSVADNAVQATDARALVNNVQVVSSTNTLGDAISGVTIDLLKKDPAATTTITVAEDSSTAKTRIQSVITAFN